MIRQSELLEFLQTIKPGKRALQGGGIALLLINLFALATSGRSYEFHAWLLVPMGMVTVGGACGGLFYAVMEPCRNRGGRTKLFINILCFVVYVTGLYLSLILGLSFTGQWD